MKITKQFAKKFEETQKKHGTIVALQNVIFFIICDLARDIGAIKIGVSYEKAKKASKKK